MNVKKNRDIDAELDSVGMNDSGFVDVLLFKILDELELYATAHYAPSELNSDDRSKWINDHKDDYGVWFKVNRSGLGYLFVDSKDDTNIYEYFIPVEDIVKGISGVDLDKYLVRTGK